MLLELLNKVVVLVVAVFKIADDCIPDSKVVVKVTIIFFPLFQDLECQIHTVFESVYHVMVIFAYVQEEVDVFGEWQCVNLLLRIGTHISSNDGADDSRDDESNYITNHPFLARQNGVRRSA